MLLPGVQKEGCLSGRHRCESLDAQSRIIDCVTVFRQRGSVSALLSAIYRLQYIYVWSDSQAFESLALAFAF